MPALDVPGDDLRYHLILQPKTSAVIQKTDPIAGVSEVKSKNVSMIARIVH